MPDPSEANGGQFHPAGTQQPHGVRASRGGGHRGRRPDHDDTGIARELVRASLASCLNKARISTEAIPPGSPPRDQSSPRKARRSAGSILVRKRGDDRYEGTSGHRKGTSEGR